MIQCLLNVLQVGDNFVLNALRQFHVFHCSVCRVDLALELCGFLIQIGYDESHVTKNIRIDDRSNCNERRNEGHLESSPRQYIVAC